MCSRRRRRTRGQHVDRAALVARLQRHRAGGDERHRRAAAADGHAHDGAGRRARRRPEGPVHPGAGTLVVCAGAAADGTILTAANGVATCNVSLLQLLQVVFSWGYTAKFAGNPPYLGSQGSAGVL